MSKAKSRNVIEEEIVFVADPESRGVPAWETWTVWAGLPGGAWTLGGDHATKAQAMRVRKDLVASGHFVAVSHLKLPAIPAIPAQSASKAQAKRVRRAKT